MPSPSSNNSNVKFSTIVASVLLIFIISVCTMTFIVNPYLSQKKIEKEEAEVIKIIENAKKLFEKKEYQESKAILESVLETNQNQPLAKELLLKIQNEFKVLRINRLSLKAKNYFKDHEYNKAQKAVKSILAIEKKHKFANELQAKLKDKKQTNERSAKTIDSLSRIAQELKKHSKTWKLSKKLAFTKDSIERDWITPKGKAKMAIEKINGKDVYCLELNCESGGDIYATLKQEYPGQIKVEYTAKMLTDPKGGDLSIYLNSTQADIEDAIFFGFGAGANTETRISLASNHLILSKERKHLFTPGKIHHVQVSRDDLAHFTIDKKHTLESKYFARFSEDHKFIRLYTYGSKIRIYSLIIYTKSELQNDAYKREHAIACEKANITNKELTAIIEGCISQLEQEDFNKSEKAKNDIIKIGRIASPLILSKLLKTKKEIYKEIYHAISVKKTNLGLNK